MLLLVCRLVIEEINMQIKPGDKIYGHWGAQFPTVYGIVDRVDDNGVVYFSDRYAPEEVHTCPLEYIQPLRGNVSIEELPLAVGVYA